ncbi:2-hydroxyacyl-CoA dehydratase [uncultured Ilyobacter sp.]|uniref:2-hydroxyacyl-CoA dehydratase family protein n=1 Tax=uncultured Ilyobacter sp. TaxID=544433 RepID=UPI0029F54135|nr:2-hydroxyacyl-CoA dehydratase [uncultured Ilyobacter sp.]
MKKIGITTTVPTEVLIAAGYTPVDLNNLFITSDEYYRYIDIAERGGFPKSMCAWIKGIYGACLENNITEIIGVTEGDCSNTKVLLEVLKSKGVKGHPFAFPHCHTRESVKREISKFMDNFRVSLEDVEKVRQEINLLRKDAIRLDELTYIDEKADGFENHLFQLCLSDFDGNMEKYGEFLKGKINQIEKREKKPKKLRLGYLGVPPMQGDLHHFVEKFDARFVYNEVQREFAFPRAVEAENIFEQYYDYTYPYDIEYRLKDITEQIKLRKLDGIIHYTQAFCHRAIEDIILKEKLDIPVMNIEGDKLNSLDARTKLRLEAFLDMLHDLKS